MKKYDAWFKKHGGDYRNYFPTLPKDIRQEVYCACIRPHSHWNVHFRQQGFSISQRPGNAVRSIDLQAAIRHDQQFVIRIDFRTDVRVFGEGKDRNAVLPVAYGL